MKNFMNSILKYFSPELIGSTKRILKFLFIYTIGFFIVAVGFKYAIPFVIAFFIAMALRPLKNKILSINSKYKKFKISEGLVSIILTLLIIVIVSLLIFVIGYKITEQFKSYYSYITDKETLNNLLNTANESLQKVLVGMDNISPDIEDKLSEILTKIISIVSSLTSELVGSLLNIIVSIPIAVLMIIITIIATIFLVKDIDKVLQKIKGAFSEKGLQVLRRIQDKKNVIVGGYIKAYSLIMIAICIYSILIYKVAGFKYAIVIGIITALLDALPLIGAGMVYGIVAMGSLFTGDIKGAIIVLVGYIGAVFIRQFLEQKLVSSLLGLHPLVIIIGLFLALTPIGFIGTFYLIGGCLLYKIISLPK
ncbi:AI-2E family transporter [Clostridium vincentii]|uniref:Pheromone autoinducer 2 transporter n=1 Tax=Clostridium vincentii TaxID=52704 RepID=A0A2T0BJ01_9CLOT|nr:AI-2E family transporter [Clostridium vincentii]PRR83854.1 hypothetical protein CLVI_05080 [Clostridium vincentii]